MSTKLSGPRRTAARHTTTLIRAWQAGLLGCALAACSTPPPPPPPSKLPRPTIRPALQPGCLLPEQALFDGAPMASTVDLRVKVEASGIASSVAVMNSTGSARLDEAFVASALKCRYTPATQDSTAVAHTYVVTQTWIAGQPFTGPRRCFMPDYPLAALRNEQVGVVRLRFMVPAADAPAQVVVMPVTTPVLVPPAKASATACLMHPEARQGLKPGYWYEVSYNFRLD